MRNQLFISNFHSVARDVHLVIGKIGNLGRNRIIRPQKTEIGKVEVLRMEALKCRGLRSAAMVAPTFQSAGALAVSPTALRPTTRIRSGPGGP